MTQLAQAVFIFSLAITATLVGFVACLALHAHFRHTGEHGARRAIAGWGAVFFAGAAFFSVNWGMGERAVISILPPAGPMSFGTPVAVWLITCMAGWCVQLCKMVIVFEHYELERMRTRHQGHVPLHQAGNACLVVTMLAASMLSFGCAAGRAPTAVGAESESLTATEPFARCYVEHHPAEKQGVDDFYAAWQSRLNAEKAAEPK